MYSRKKKSATGNKLVVRRGQTTTYANTKYNKWTRRMLRQTSCDSTLQYIVSDRAETSTGYQQMYWWKALGTNGSGYPTSDPGSQSLDDLRKLLWNVFSNAIAPPVGLATRKVIIDKLVWEFEFTNAAQIPANIEMFECIARRDNSEDPLTRVSEGLTREGLFTTLASVPYQTYGVSPFDSSAFCQYWKIIKKSNIVLLPGRQHKHTMVHQIKKAINAEDIEVSTQHFRGLTRILVLRIWGSIVNDDTVKTSVTAGTVAIDMMTRKKIYYGLEAPQNPQLTTVINNLPLPVGVTPESFMNAETGNVDTTNALA